MKKAEEYANSKEPEDFLKVYTAYKDGYTAHKTEGTMRFIIGFMIGVIVCIVIVTLVDFNSFFTKR